MNHPVQTIWIVTREYAGIAEAGGVKNVACSLAEGLVRQNKNITVFIPYYGCVQTVSTLSFASVVTVGMHSYPVSFSKAMLHGVEIIFVHSSLYTKKRAVYVYTEKDALLSPTHIRGKGHTDGDLMNMILQKAVLRYSFLSNRVPDVLHCQDAHTALLPALIRTSPKLNKLFAKTKIAVTIHNAGPGYRQVIHGVKKAALLTGLSESVLNKALFNGNIEPFLLASEYGTLTTVSPWYAKELTSEKYNDFTEGLSGEFERRGVHIIGITNGIDFDKYQTRDSTCSLLPFSFDPASGDLTGKYRCRDYFIDQLSNFHGPSEIKCYGSIKRDPHAVYFSYHGRIAWQKGLDVLEKSVKAVLDQIPQARFIVLGQGDSVLESMLIGLADKYPGHFVYLQGYERALARLAVAVSDFLVMPSIFEPCGLEDFIGQIFGTIPVAHAVGGLQKIIDGRSGFLYYTEGASNDAEVLADLLIKVASPIVKSKKEGCIYVPGYLEMIKYASTLVHDTYNWNSIITNHYLPLYEKIDSPSA